MTTASIKKISLNSEDLPGELAAALSDTGFAILTDHAISEQLIAQVYADWAQFFADPAKSSHLQAEGQQAGFFPMKSENAKGYSAKDLKEFYHFYRADYERRAHFLPAAVWTSYRLTQGLDRVADAVLDALDTVLPDTVKALTPMTVGSPNTLLRALHYPALPAVLDEPSAVRAAPHADINLITLLPAATAPGLQVKTLDGTWIDVDTNPGEIILNVGDMLQEVSSGFLKSTEHRVVNPQDENISRYSLPYFIHPRSEVRLSDRYTAEEYLNERLKELGLLKGV